jgi:hypothetical protein
MIESQFSDDNNLKPDRNSAAAYHDHSHDVSFFQICRSCFWCTSTLHATRMIKICPVCTSEGIDSLPISPNEVYSYDVSGSANLSLSFNSSIQKYKERKTIRFQIKDICVNYGRSKMPPVPPVPLVLFLKKLES